MSSKMLSGASGHAEAHRQLFLAVAEELKMPLMHIGRQAELLRLSHTEASDANLRDIQETSDVSLKLLDSYLLSLRLGMEAEAKLSLEPVSLAAVLHDTEKQLKATARQYGVELELHLRGKYEPVLANPQALSGILLSLGYALIEALPATGASSQTLRLAAHRSKYGLVAGVYGDFATLKPSVLRKGRDLHGYVRQPLVAAMPGSGAGVFMADSIAQAMASRVRVGRFQKLPGFALTFAPSTQLQLV